MGARDLLGWAGWSPSYSRGATGQAPGMWPWPDPNAPAKKRADELEAAIREHAGVVVREMEAYYRDGRHPDLRPVLRAGRALLELTGKEA